MNGIGWAIIILLLLIIVSLLLFIIYSVLFQARWLMWIINKINSKALFYFSIKTKIIALTVDDAPSNQTQEFLDLFKRYGVHVTFFIIGERVNGREEKMKRIIEEGHEIGNHTYYDEPSFKNTKEEFEDKLRRTDEVMKPYSLNQRYRWFRPGSGIPSSFMYDSLEKYGYKMVIGSCHAFDAQIKNCSYTSFILKHGICNGDIVIVHDREYTLPEVEGFLEYCKDKKIQIMSLGEMCDYMNDLQNEEINSTIHKPILPHSFPTPESHSQSINEYLH
ncbi:hypothetical protein ENUP19_0305G0083 [Entamoeba nuttalli]|uniref:Polysaccharide deacetylase, putative n=2 Tax=Entamoeba nuttalli TaxID=412467 RepID=K2HWI6_ENTNP|nr:polysaccharide deacetylase, putative [Entamoeba nuttalli P19]EKE40605.1 polysaccharide deacetylase, putative [Entamoeba nuttalli P19]|eukprot:XP_008857081.1 polysaccharide deacetylase, putative [Entamoeba nuttalli P19]